ncbi:MAG: hypothetical protein O2992_11570 [Gemmatimonadetes bacterium]|nr:hypothetical protein [Gemmatimonadota bacterium]
MFDERDGMVDTPRGILLARSGETWVMGSHRGGSALARLRPATGAAAGGARWERFTTADGLPGERIEGYGAAYEASDGTLWFGAGIDSTANLGAGLVRFDPGADSSSRWMHFTEEADSLTGGLITGMAEWPRGTLWIGAGNGLHRIDLADLPARRTWRHWDRSVFGVNLPKFGSLTPTEEGLWFVPFFPRGAGVFLYDGRDFRQFRESDGLPDRGIRRLVVGRDGALWFVGPSGLARYAGGSWERFREGDGVKPSAQGNLLWSALTESRDGDLWFRAVSGEVVRFRYEKRPRPETFIEPTISEVSAAGNILIRWSGAVPWNRTPPDKLGYTWRLDGGTWTPADRPDVTLTGLAAGRHTFEVRAIDPDGPGDPTPAIHAFTVDLVWWRNPLVAGPGLLLVMALGWQSVRVVRRDRRLTASNRALSDANHELFRVNQALDRDRAMANIRAEVQAMDRVEDFEKILAMMTKDLAAQGLGFASCEIDLLEEKSGGKVSHQQAATPHLAVFG